MLSGQLNLFAPPRMATESSERLADLLANLMSTRADGDGWLRMSQKKIAAELGCSPTTSRRTIDRLYAADRIDFDYDRDPVDPKSIQGVMLRLRGARRTGGRRG